PYLVSVPCEFQHPQPKPFRSSTNSAATGFGDAILKIAGVSDFTSARRFLGISGSGERPAASANSVEFATWLRESFYPNVKPPSDLEFLTQQGVLSTAQPLEKKEILYRLIDKKG